MTPHRPQVGHAHGDLVDERGDGEHAVLGGLHRDGLGVGGSPQLVEEVARVLVDHLGLRALGHLPEEAGPKEDILSEDADGVFHAPPSLVKRRSGLKCEVHREGEKP